MSWREPDEDAYWENYREEYEHGFRPKSEWADMENEPVYEERNLYLDEEGQTEELEAEYGYPMEQLDDEDLREIVKRFTNGKEEPDEEHELRWDPRSWCIEYTVQIA